MQGVAGCEGAAEFAIMVLQPHVFRLSGSWLLVRNTLHGSLNAEGCARILRVVHELESTGAHLLRRSVICAHVLAG